MKRFLQRAMRQGFYVSIIVLATLGVVIGNEKLRRPLCRIESPKIVARAQVPTDGPSLRFSERANRYTQSSRAPVKAAKAASKSPTQSLSKTHGKKVAEHHAKRAAKLAKNTQARKAKKLRVANNRS